MTDTRERIRARAKSLGANEEQFRDQLFGLRRLHGLSQEQVAEGMGVSQSVITRLERYDSNPTLSTLRRYALAAEVRLNFEAVSDHPYILADAPDMPTFSAEPATATPSLDWNSRKVESYA